MDAIDYLPAALAAVAPRITFRREWEAALTAPMRAAGLTTARRAAMFLGQCAEESGGFTVLLENLNYTASRICEVWPHRFSALADAQSYARRPAGLGNHVYCDRLGNGDEASGDGYRFRGAGPIQLTGRTYWTRFGASVHRSAEEAWDWSQTPAGAAASACWYWIDRGGLLELSDAWAIDAVTLRINGGMTNAGVRVNLCNAALRAFGRTTPAPAPDEEPPDDLNAAELARIRGQT